MSIVILALVAFAIGVVIGLVFGAWITAAVMYLLHYEDP